MHRALDVFDFRQRRTRSTQELSWTPETCKIEYPGLPRPTSHHHHWRLCPSAPLTKRRPALAQRTSDGSSNHQKIPGSRPHKFSTTARRRRQKQHHQRWGSNHPRIDSVKERRVESVVGTFLRSLPDPSQVDFVNRHHGGLCTDLRPATAGGDALAANDNVKSIRPSSFRGMFFLISVPQNARPTDLPSMMSTLPPTKLKSVPDPGVFRAQTSAVSRRRPLSCQCH